MGASAYGGWWRLGAVAALIATGCQTLPSAKMPAPSGVQAAQVGLEARVPPGFLWGVSVAGHQVDGNDTSSNWARWAAQGRTAEHPGRAVDFWHRYDGDFAMARQTMGVNAFRLSVEWSRLEPVKGHWDERAAAHYRNMFASARRHGLTPIITLSHWTMPAWVDDEGGWANREVVARFGRYVEKVATDIAPGNKWWITFNEPNLWIPRDYLLGWGPPGVKNPAKMVNAARNVVRGHALAYDLLHERIPGAMVSSNSYEILFGRGQTKDPIGFIDTNWLYEASDTGRLPGTVEGEPDLEVNLTGKMDYVAFDYYWTFSTIREALTIAKPWGLGMAPDRLEQVLLRYHQKYAGLPQLIAENGIATEDGRPRPDGWTRESALAATVAAMKRAMAKGANVAGYCYWSLTDNYEWGTYTPRFGLFTVDARHDPALRRVPTPAVETYRRIIAGEPVVAIRPGDASMGRGLTPAYR